MYPQDLVLFPRDEDWATGDEHLDKKLNSILLTNYSHLSLGSIEKFYYESKEIKTRVANPSFYLVIEFCTKALIGLLDAELEVDQEFLKIKGKKSLYEKYTNKIELDLAELKTKKHQRFFSSLDIFLREQAEFEQNPFVSFKLKKAVNFFEFKIIFKDLIERLNRSEHQNFEHEMFKLLSQKKVVEIVDIGQVWFHQGMIFCVND